MICKIFIMSANKRFIHISDKKISQLSSIVMQMYLNIKMTTGEFKMTYQAPANWWSLFSCMVPVVARNLFSGHQC